MPSPRLDITPRRGIGPIELGMNPIQVADALLMLGCEDLEDAARPEFDRAFSNSLQIDYAPETQECRSIGIYWHPDCGCECFINDQHIADYSAEQLFNLLAQLDGGDHEYCEQAGHIFPNIAMQVFDLSKTHDYRDHESRLVYGEVIVGHFNRREPSPQPVA